MAIQTKYYELTWKTNAVFYSKLFQLGMSLTSVFFSFLELIKQQLIRERINLTDINIPLSDLQSD